MPFAPQIREEREPLNEAGLYDYALKALGRHMRTEAELKRLMQARVEPDAHGEAAVQAVIARLKERKYLDDQRHSPRPTHDCGRRIKSSRRVACATTCGRRVFATT